MKISFSDYVRAGFPLLLVETHEDHRAIKTLTNELNKKTPVYTWDICDGLIDLRSDTVFCMKKGKFVDRNGPPPPPVPMKSPEDVCLFLHDKLAFGSVVFIKDAHRHFNKSINLIRRVKNSLPGYKVSQKHLVFVSPLIDIPVELEKDVTIVDFPLPSIDDLMAKTKSLIADNDLKMPIKEDTISSAKGLTLDEAEQIISLSIIKDKKKISKGIIETGKHQMVTKCGLVEIYPPIAMELLGGMRPLKKYFTNRIKGFSDRTLPTPKGILLVGVPGAGKSMSAKVAASVLDTILLRVDIGALKASHVGESEKNLRLVTKLVDSLDRCVVWIDEVEKGLSGVQSSGYTDGGTTANMFAHLLTWMQETTSDVYIVATCNEIKVIQKVSQGAFMRRFDDTFLVDLPGEEEKLEILKLKCEEYGAKLKDHKGLVKQMVNWTGAEIEKFVQASFYDGVKESIENIKPIFMQNNEEIDEVRNWAAMNARLANEPDVVKAASKVDGKSTTKLVIDDDDYDEEV